VTHRCSAPGFKSVGFCASSYAHGVSRLPLLGQTIGENLRATAERFPGREALVVRSQGYRATYRQLWDATTACARGLLALGVRPGDRVGVWSANRCEWVVVQYATARPGADGPGRAARHWRRCRRCAPGDRPVRQARRSPCPRRNRGRRHASPSPGRLRGARGGCPVRRVRAKCAGGRWPLRRWRAHKAPGRWEAQPQRYGRGDAARQAGTPSSAGGST